MQFIMITIKTICTYNLTNPVSERLQDERQNLTHMRNRKI